MTLHENLERRRRQKVPALNKSGACHLCECTSGSGPSIHRFVSHDDASDFEEDSSCCEATSDAPLEPTPMRQCMCYGNVADWPYPLRVCEQCIAEDATTGRIRLCGICGVVACDDKCGVELVEVTDRESWNNAGCLECRGMESFSELELFRRRPYPNGIPRATRVCTSCLELFSLFSFGNKYHFTCRYFKCNNLLVPSHVVELKRYLKPFPLSLLPEELMESIVDFLGGRDLFSFGMTCTAMFRKVERVSMEIVTRHNLDLPTGPVQSAVRQVQNNGTRKVMYPEGKNRHPLQVPEDGKTWVGVLNQMEHLVRSAFYFDFQIDGGDDGCAMRYLRRRNKLSFDRVYSKGPGAQQQIVPYFDASSNGLVVTGGQVLVTRYRWHHTISFLEREDRQNVRSAIFSTDKVLSTGIYRAIVRYYCFCEGESLGSIGILRQRADGSMAWAHNCSVTCEGRMEEHVFGMEYDADRHTLLLYKKNERTNRMVSTATDGRPLTALSDYFAAPDEDPNCGAYCFGVTLSSGTVGIKGNQLSIRACSDEEWSAFLSHTIQRNTIPRIRGRSRRGEERLMRYLDHRHRRAALAADNAANEDHDHDAVAARIELEHMMDEIAGRHDDDDDDSDAESDLSIVGSEENDGGAAAPVPFLQRINEMVRRNRNIA